MRERARKQAGGNSGRRTRPSPGPLPSRSAGAVIAARNHGSPDDHRRGHPRAATRPRGDHRPQSRRAVSDLSGTRPPPISGRALASERCSLPFLGILFGSKTLSGSASARLQLRKPPTQPRAGDLPLGSNSTAPDGGLGRGVRVAIDADKIATVGESVIESTLTADAIEAALATALSEATAAGKWDVVSQLAYSGRIRSPVSVRPDHSFRTHPITHFGVPDR